MDAFRSGLLLLAVFAGNLSMKPATSWVLRRFGFRTTLIGNGLFAAASILACCLFTPPTPKWIIASVLFIGGVFRSMQFTALNTLGFADVPPAQMSGANTLASMIPQLTIGLGVAFGALALRLAALRHPGEASLLTVGDFRLAFAMVGLLAVAANYDCWLLPATAGALVSGHNRPDSLAA
jgi:MFS family permease